MNSTPMSAWRMGAMVFACGICTAILIVSGCGTPAGTAGAVAAAAASDLVAAATQPTTQKVMTGASAGAASNSQNSQAIFGRWVRKGNVINSDGSYATGLLCEWKFNKNGSFQNQARAGVANTTYMMGNFKVVGGVLTLSLGKAQQIYDFQIRGSELLLTNPQTRQTVILQRG